MDLCDSMSSVRCKKRMICHCGLSQLLGVCLVLQATSILLNGMMYVEQLESPHSAFLSESSESSLLLAILSLHSRLILSARRMKRMNRVVNRSISASFQSVNSEDYQLVRFLRGEKSEES